MSIRRIPSRAHVAWNYAAWVLPFRAMRRRVLVLRYHAIGRPEDVAAYASPGISVTRERFDAQVGFLTRHYDVIDLDAAAARVAGEDTPRRPGVVITFDDGYRDNFEHALPVLRKHGATGTFYVVAGSVWPGPALWTVRLRHIVPRADGSVRDLTRKLRALPADLRERELRELAARAGRDDGAGSRIMMDAAEIKAMVEGGMTIGAHTLTHPLLPEVPEAEARHELVAGRATLEAIVGRPVTHLSYPNPGDGAQHDASVRAAAREAGYVSATTSTGGILSRSSDPLAIPRVGVTPGFQERLLFRFLGER